jgi:hypothetical protein
MAHRHVVVLEEKEQIHIRQVHAFGWCDYMGCRPLPFVIPSRRDQRMA